VESSVATFGGDWNPRTSAHRALGRFVGVLTLYVIINLTRLTGDDLAVAGSRPPATQRLLQERTWES